MDSNLIIILGDIRNTQSPYNDNTLCDSMGKIIKAKNTTEPFRKSWLCDMDTSVECHCFNCPLTVFADTWLEVIGNEAKLIENSNSRPK